ncbi:hypothetical protein ACIRRH_31075 [Kitasatospora sp. NPDC101235]|uniref:hypothetical protein n=1 Tax=Kitasatospora sp. NPDC101235 TaxID=3364101 RepID=UPI00381411A0
MVWTEVALGIAVLVVLPFIAGSARTEAGNPKPVFSGSILTTGAVLTAALALSLYATAKASDALARREVPSAG